jgi:uncharacterized membrane protein SpoIIM required for sporulation
VTPDRDTGWLQPRTRLPMLLAANAVLLAGAVTAGVWGAPSVGSGIQPARVPGTEAAVFVPVILANGKVLALMMLGTVSLGLLSALLVVWNGIHLGAGLAPLFEAQPAVAWLVMRYVPIEFSALIVASAASMEMSYQVVRSLFARREGSFAPPMLAFAGAAVLLLIAAAIESQVASRIAAPG